MSEITQRDRQIAKIKADLYRVTKRRDEAEERRDELTEELEHAQESYELYHQDVQDLEDMLGLLERN